MNDKDKKVVNTEEQNRTVNAGESDIQEESVSQDPVRTPSEDKNETRQEDKDKSER